LEGTGLDSVLTPGIYWSFLKKEVNHRIGKVFSISAKKDHRDLDRLEIPIKGFTISQGITADINF